MNLKRLSRPDFERLADETDMGDDARAMARAVLVDGQAQTVVAEKYGVTKQRVNLAVGTIRREHAKAVLQRTTWIGVDMELPETLAAELAIFAEKMKSCSDEGRRKAAVSKLSRAVAIVNHSLE